MCVGSNKIREIHSKAHFLKFLFNCDEYVFVAGATKKRGKKDEPKEQRQISVRNN